MPKLEAWMTSRAAPLWAALVMLVCALPGLVALPVLDRDEARAAQASVQMQEEGDYTAIRFQSRLRGGAAPGAPWLQAVAVKAFSNVEARVIQPYRLPSLAGMMLAAAACVWGAAGLFGRLTGGVSGLLFAAGLFAAFAGAAAGADGLFIGASALALAAFGRIYIGVGGARTRALFWAGLILGVLVKGPLIVGLMALAAAVLFAIDRKAAWLKGLGWGWGLIALVAIAGPWVVAVTIATDGEFWSRGAEVLGEGAAFGVQTLAAPLLLFPLAALLPLAAVFAWKNRSEPGVRLAAAWVVPAWIALELSPEKQAHDAAPLYVAVVWLAAAAITADWRPALRLRQIGAALSGLAGVVLAATLVAVAGRFGGAGDVVLALFVALLVLAAAGIAALGVLVERPVPAMLAACALAVATHGLALGALLPGIERLWPTREVLAALERTGLDPRQGIAVGPVAAAGYAEPSLVFAVGAGAELGDAAEAAAAIDEGRPAIVEASEDAAFLRAARGLGVKPRAAARVEAFDYVLARPISLTIYAPPKPVTAGR
jgi:4-amino-4-deoxy-L-arabinose transferase-like glycosyltransferase